MNRIILIGNGFDLAHGLKTSYKDFIDDFWEKKEKEVIDGIHLYKPTNSYRYDDNFISIQSSHSFENMPLNLISDDNGYNWFKYYLNLNTYMKSNNRYSMTSTSMVS